MKITEVAVGVIQNKHGEYLFASRPEGKPYPGYWEFPGGKIEAGESAAQALARELYEELNIHITTVYPWIVRTHAYTHATVRLHLMRVMDWDGDLHPREGQQMVWQKLDQITVEPLLPANKPILQALRLPSVMLLTQIHAIGIDAMLERIFTIQKTQNILLQLREPEAIDADIPAWFECIYTTFPNVQIVVNSRHTAFSPLARRGEIKNSLLPVSGERARVRGHHSTSTDLMVAAEKPNEFCGASCHNVAELQHAAELNLDYVVVGPVRVTQTHPDQVPLGWQRFAEMIQHYPLPVYAIGGMRMQDLVIAWKNGAHGIAMMRG